MVHNQINETGAFYYVKTLQVIEGNSFAKMEIFDSNQGGEFACAEVFKAFQQQGRARPPRGQCQDGALLMGTQIQRYQKQGI